MNSIVQITSSVAPEPDGNNFTNCMKVGNQLFLSGMTATDTGADAYSQSVSCLEKIKALVEAADGKMTDIVKITVYLTDIRHRNNPVPPCWASVHWRDLACWSKLRQSQLSEQGISTVAGIANSHPQGIWNK